MRIEVVCALPDRAEVVIVELRPGATVADAAAAAGLQGSAFGVYGRAVAPEQKLADGDRVEIYRALLVDPKEARRRRARRRR